MTEPDAPVTPTPADPTSSGGGQDLLAGLPDHVTFRSWPALVVGGLLSLALVGGSVAMWVAMGPEARSQWTLPQLLTILFFLAVLVAIVLAVGLSKVAVGPDGVVVRNAFRTHRYAWHEVDDFTMAPGDPWAYLKFPDQGDEEGDSRLVLAVQRAEGDAAEERLETLRAYVRKYRHS